MYEGTGRGKHYSVPPSSSGLGYRPFKAVTRIRIPLGAPGSRPVIRLRYRIAPMELFERGGLDRRIVRGEDLIYYIDWGPEAPEAGYIRGAVV
jgi:hypothetical protein